MCNSRIISTFVLTILMLLSSGCTDSSTLIGPENALEIGNATDTFQWQVSALSKVSQTLSYTWNNTGTTANVNQSSSLIDGSATLQISDDAGEEVYSRSLGANGDFTTATGRAGLWTVTVTLSETTGTMNFRLQKP